MRFPFEDVGICQTLDTDTNGPVPHVAVPGLLHGVVVHVNDLVQVLSCNLGYMFQLLEVISFVGLDEHVNSNGGQVAYSHLVRSGVLHDLCTEVGALDGAKVLLVALPVASILVQHVGGASLNLALNDRVPDLLCLHSLPGSSFSLIFLIQSLKLLSPDLMQSWALVRTHQGPVTISLHPLHEQVRDPHGVEEVPGTLLLLTMILTQIQEIEDVRMPGLKVDSESSWPLVAALVDIPGGVVEDPEHGDQAVAVTISTGNIGTSGSNAVHVQANTSSRLRDEGALLQGVVDALDTVAVHGQEEAAAELGPGGGRVEQGGGGVGKKLLGEEVIGLNSTINILSMDAHGHPHQHLLGPLHTLPINLEQVGPLQGLEPKVLILKVTLVQDSSIQLVLVLLDDVGELLFRLLVKVGNSNPSSQDGIVRMLGGHGGSN